MTTDLELYYKLEDSIHPLTFRQTQTLGATLNVLHPAFTLIRVSREITAHRADDISQEFINLMSESFTQEELKKFTKFLIFDNLHFDNWHIGRLGSDFFQSVGDEYIYNLSRPQFIDLGILSLVLLYNFTYKTYGNTKPLFNILKKDS